jgi:hypothetical protein
VRESIGFRGKNIEYLERKRYYGFENNKIRRFLKLSFYTFKSMKNLRYKIANELFMINGKEYKFPLYESNIDPILRFTHLRDILTAGWIMVPRGKYTNYECNWESITNYSNGEFETKLIAALNSNEALVSLLKRAGQVNPVNKRLLTKLVRQLVAGLK